MANGSLVARRRTRQPDIYIAGAYKYGLAILVAANLKELGVSETYKLPSIMTGAC